MANRHFCQSGQVGKQRQILLIEVVTGIDAQACVQSRLRSLGELPIAVLGTLVRGAVLPKGLGIGAGIKLYAIGTIVSGNRHVFDHGIHKQADPSAGLLASFNVSA